jgi:hypothetical protein
LLLGGKKGAANRSLHPLNPNSRLVGDVSHAWLIVKGPSRGEGI